MKPFFPLMVAAVVLLAAADASASCCYPQRQYRGRTYKFTSYVHYPAVWYSDCDVLTTYKIPGAATWPGLNRATHVQTTVRTAEAPAPPPPRSY